MLCQERLAHAKVAVGEFHFKEMKSITTGAGLALAANDRVQVHLPGFAGGYNSFATTGPASGLGIGEPSSAHLHVPLLASAS